VSAAQKLSVWKDGEALAVASAHRLAIVGPRNKGISRCQVATACAVCDDQCDTFSYRSGEQKPGSESLGTLVIRCSCDRFDYAKRAKKHFVGVPRLCQKSIQMIFSTHYPMPSYWTRAVNSASAAKRFSISDFYPTEVGQEGCSVGGEHEWE